MLHPSYGDLMEIVNSGVEEGEQPIVNSRYSIVMATAKRARQLIDGKEALATAKCNKPFSTAVEELYRGEVKILSEEEAQVALAEAQKYAQAALEEEEALLDFGEEFAEEDTEE